MSQFKFTRNFGLSTTIRALGVKSSSNTHYNYGHIEGTIDSEEQEYVDVYFRSLYFTYKLSTFDFISNYKHMIAFGTVPFQNGAWIQYKKSTPQEANGLSMMFDMTFDALVYVCDFSKYINADMFQVRIGGGEHMKFKDIYHQNRHISDAFIGTKVGFINFDYKKGPHNLKLEAYRTDWKYESVDAGDSSQIGFGYALDKLEDDGYVIYGTVAMSRSTTGSFMDYYVMNTSPPKPSESYPNEILPVETDSLPAGFDRNDYAVGWAFDIGVKKEFWIETFDVDLFVGVEYFMSSDEWVATTLSGYSKCSINTSLRGNATDLYTGIKFSHNKILTFSWIRENRTHTSAAINDVNGKLFENKNTLTHRNVFMAEFTWLFH